MVVVTAMLACNGSPEGRAEVEAVPRPPGEVAAESVTMRIDDTARVATITPPMPDSAAVSDSTPVGVPDRSDIGWVTVHDLLAGSSHVGHRVRVEGRCLGYSSPLVITGPPVTRSDWLLEDSGEAIYVSGVFPAECSPTDGSDERITVLGLVQQDTIGTQGDGTPILRRFLVREIPRRQ